MSILLVISAVAAATMTFAVTRMLLPRIRGQLAARAALSTAIAAAVTVTAGSVLDVESPTFLLALSFAVAPVSVLLGAAAREAVPEESARGRVLVFVWAGVVFPICAVVPTAVLDACAAPECRVADFGGALPLLVSSAATVLLAWRPRGAVAEQGWRGFGLAAGLVWLSGAVWLASLEGAWDAYLVRVAVAAVVAPLGGALAWLLVDLVRQMPRHPVRSLADGALAGLVAIVPGAATISFPWTIVVGVSAGAAAAVVYSARRIARVGRAGHWALVVFVSTAIGYLAPAVSGDTIGFIFSGRIGALVPPVALFAAVALFGMAVTAPLWVVRRRRRLEDEAGA